MKLMSETLFTVSYFTVLLLAPSKVFLQNCERFEPRSHFKFQVDRFISKDLNGWTCMRLIDVLVLTEESRTVYLVIGN